MDILDDLVDGERGGGDLKPDPTKGPSAWLSKHRSSRAVQCRYQCSRETGGGGRSHGY